MNTRISVLTVILSIILSANILAAPAAPIEVQLSQPDGTTFIAIPRGDEFANWMETRSGHTIIKTLGTWYYAEKDNVGNLSASQFQVGRLSPSQLQTMPRHLAPRPDQEAFAPTTVRKIPRPGAAWSEGDFSTPVAHAISHAQYVLTVLVDYSNQSFTYSDSNFQTLMYGAGSSVKDFFRENSYDGFTITAPAETQGVGNDGIVHVTRPVSHPNQGDTTATSKSEAREVFSLADAYIDFSSYDSNGDGFVSAAELSMVIIVAGYENGYGGASALTPRVWGHMSNLAASIDLDGVTLSPYTMFGESHATNPGNKHQATIGIMCHELGHLMLGLPDLYDTDGSAEGIGDWGLMGSGSWNKSGTYPGDSPSHMGAWSKVATDFTIPEDIDVDQSGVSIANAESNEVAKRIWIDKYKSELSYEYFLLENRQRSGYDTGLPGDGLLIWHIDDSLFTNSNESHKWVDLEAADGDTDLDSGTNGGDNGDPFPGSTAHTTFDDSSTPNSRNYAGTSNLIGVTGITASGATMTANIAALSGGVGDHVRYDENGFTNIADITGSTTAWVGIRALNDTAFTGFDGIDVYVNDNAGATIDISYYTSMTGGTPSGLIHSQTGFAAVPGWNRLLLSVPQSFPAGVERGVVLKVVNNNSTRPIVIDGTGVASGRSYYDSNGIGTFTPLCPAICGDVNLVLLLSGSAISSPTATIITPDSTGPTNADSMSFDVTFSEDVLNFNNSADVVITHSGTSHGGVTINGSGSSYDLNVTGITGNGSFSLEVSTGSDVENTTGVALSASVTSAAVSIDNLAPTLTIGAPSASSTRKSPVSYKITYVGADTVSLAQGDITLNTSATATGSVTVSGSGTNNRTVMINDIGGDGSLGISIASDTAGDDAGNSATAAGPSGTVSVDNTAPTLTIGAPSAISTTSGPVSFTVTYSEADSVTLGQGDVTLNKTGTAEGSVSVSGTGQTTRTITISSITGDGSLGISIGANTAVDGAGNKAGAAGPSDNFSVQYIETILKDSFE